MDMQSRKLDLKIASRTVGTVTPTVHHRTLAWHRTKPIISTPSGANWGLPRQLYIGLGLSLDLYPWPPDRTLHTSFKNSFTTPTETSLTQSPKLNNTLIHFSVVHSSTSPTHAATSSLTYSTHHPLLQPLVPPTHAVLL